MYQWPMEGGGHGGVRASMVHGGSMHQLSRGTSVYTYFTR